MRCDLNGRVVFVTGGAGGIGRATVKRLAENGAAVVVADIDAAGAEAVAASLPDALGLALDVRDPDAAERAVAATLARYGRLDVLVNNAGVNTFKDRVDIDAFPKEEWHRVVSIDLDGLYVVSRAAVQPMIRQGAGRIVNIASVVGVTAMRLQSAFVAAKAGVIHLTRSMALELGPKGILVNALAPGSVLTEGTKKLFYGDDGTFRAQMAAFLDHVPLGRPADVEEIAEAILFLAAPENSYMTGHLMMVDGGWTAGFMM
ncbi:SDR family NAD(P)-dependent oxidoreductase [Prosthecomicrobium pneumaticum]|uniref:NAD(P)-dependent dehydrogenase (Short-subunit alcohol dehydrogenase family) n=1 Tax=Prosthecomicrobium pneumaticum TaxID=81895 RepID=A0A7W9FJY5_9HYPH|nr:SDR family NAD(P)-dependent oxidoreductase [Prosthecomicrobium pneumaticum]MBB5752217.1 NAD(P)-dependent dehydrogenase (short-subunit alcohol dehydrogenase family) [Prosthecomicrobium pneumaticum]